MAQKQLLYQIPSTKYSETLTNIATTGMDTDSSDDNIAPTSWRILKNVNISKIGAIEPRKGYASNFDNSVQLDTTGIIDFDENNFQCIVNWQTSNSLQSNNFYIIDGYLFDNTGKNITSDIKLVVHNEWGEKFIPSSNAIDVPGGLKQETLASKFKNTFSPTPGTKSAKGTLSAQSDIDFVLVNYIQDVQIQLEIKGTILGQAFDEKITLPVEITSQNPKFPIQVSYDVPVLGTLSFDIVSIDEISKDSSSFEISLDYENASTLAQNVFNVFNDGGTASNFIRINVIFDPKKVNLLGNGRLNRTITDITPLYYDQKVYVPISSTHGNNTSFLLVYDGSNWNFEDPFVPQFSGIDNIGFNNLVEASYEKSKVLLSYDYTQSKLNNWLRMNQLDRRLNWYTKTYSEIVSSSTITKDDKFPFYQQAESMPYQLTEISIYPYEASIFRNVSQGTGKTTGGEDPDIKYTFETKPNFTPHSMKQLFSIQKIVSSNVFKRLAEIWGYRGATRVKVEIKINGESIFTTQQQQALSSTLIVPFTDRGRFGASNLETFLPVNINGGFQWYDELQASEVNTLTIVNEHWKRERQMSSLQPLTLFPDTPGRNSAPNNSIDENVLNPDKTTISTALTNALKDDLQNNTSKIKLELIITGVGEGAGAQDGKSKATIDFSDEYNNFKLTAQGSGAKLKTFPSNGKFDINWRMITRNIGFNRSDATLSFYMSQVGLKYTGDNLVYEFAENVVDGSGVMYVKSNLVANDLNALKSIELQTKLPLEWEDGDTTNKYFIAWYWIPWNETEQIKDNIRGTNNPDGLFYLIAPDVDTNSKQEINNDFTGLEPNLNRWFPLAIIKQGTPKSLELIPNYKIPNLNTAIKFFPPNNNFLVACAIHLIKKVAAAQLPDNISDFPYHSIWKEIKLNPMIDDSLIDTKDFISCGTGDIINSQLFLFNGNVGSRIFFSYPLKLNYFPHDNYLDLKQLIKGDSISKIVPFKNNFVLFSKFKMILMTGNEESKWSFKDFEGGVGALSRDSVIEYAGGVYFLALDGFRKLKSNYVDDGRVASPLISNKINQEVVLPLIQACKDAKQEHLIRGVKHKNILYWFFPTSGSDNKSINVVEEEQKVKGICLKYYPLLSQETGQDVWTIDESEVFADIKNVYVDDILDTLTIVKIIDGRIHYFILNETNEDVSYKDRIYSELNEVAPGKKEIDFAYRTEIKSQTYLLSYPLNPKKFKQIQWKFDLLDVGNFFNTSNQDNKNIKLFANVYIDNVLVSSSKKQTPKLVKDANGNLVFQNVEEEIPVELNRGSNLNNTFDLDSSQANNTRTLIKGANTNNLRGYGISFVLRMDEPAAYQLNSINIIYRLKRAKAKKGQLINQHNQNNN